MTGVGAVEQSVLGTCRRLLRHAADVDDAFQATFLVLLRKARSVSRGEALGAWLYRVAYRVALRARAADAQVHGDAGRSLVPHAHRKIQRDLQGGRNAS
jgi:DNA-directed RNA polymerase specialized sigma24 family protein